VEGALLLEESWGDEEALHRHLRSESFRHILLVVEMAAETPEIRFDWVDRSAGIEFVETARGHRGTPGGLVTA
jgi:quinol monooxygenase YgiN